jgi:hypothetical protein
VCGPRTLVSSAQTIHYRLVMLTLFIVQAMLADADCSELLLDDRSDQLVMLTQLIAGTLTRQYHYCMQWLPQQLLPNAANQKNQHSTLCTSRSATISHQHSNTKSPYIVCRTQHHG